MSEQNITFAKIVANPNLYSWSQVYNSGKLFAVLSLESHEDSEEKDQLNVIGKDILDVLEQEYYSLESKDLDTIEKAVLVTSEKIPQNIICSFVVGAFVNSVLYVYIVGNGKIALKRSGNLGNLLEASDQKPDSIKKASGYLQDDDVLILQTKQFSNIVSISTLSEFLDSHSPADAAENIAPLVHEKEEAGAAAIIIAYKSPAVEQDVLAPIKEDILEETEEEDIASKQDEKPNSPFYSSNIDSKDGFVKKIKNLLSPAKISLKPDLNHPRKVILTIVLVIIIVFAGSVFFAIKKQENSKVLSLFNSVYPEASKKYDEGKGLMDLNQNLARDSFSEAKRILDDSKNKFPKDSTQEKQILDLLSKVNSELNSTSGVESSNAKEISNSSNDFLNSETKNDAIYFSYDDKKIYGLTSENIFSLNKDGSNKETLIKNDNSWEDGIAVYPYNGNVYVLDKKSDQIIKFVAADSGFSESNYFSDTKPDLSNAVSMAIDSSVYILYSNGNIEKFTKGKSETFSVTGLDTKLSAPKRIFTTKDLDNIYILDNGNSRVVVLDKTGVYKAQYQASVIKAAEDFDVSEEDKKIQILSKDKLYEITLK
jgi:hypothetical protein